MDLDHVAIATPNANAALKVFVGDWGGRDLWGGLGVGFRPMQVQLGDGMRIELLEPWDTEHFDFLARFLAKHGAGPHHITFKVKDLAAEIARFDDIGYQLVNINLDNPFWKEAFFMPKDAHGTVVQVAQASHTPEEMETMDIGEHRERWWDAPARAEGVNVALRRVVLASSDVAATRTFFGDVLRAETRDVDDEHVDCTWPGGGCIRIEHRTDRAPGIDRLECDSTGPTGTHTVEGATFVLSTANL